MSTTLLRIIERDNHNHRHGRVEGAIDTSAVPGQGSRVFRNSSFARPPEDDDTYKCSFSFPSPSPDREDSRKVSRVVQELPAADVEKKKCVARVTHTNQPSLLVDRVCHIEPLR